MTKDFFMLWVRALRLHQWAKNLLVFVPLLLSGRVLVADASLHAIMAFVAFGFLASGTYLVNDIVDRDADRQHPTKSRRAIASGNITLPAAVAVCVLLIGLAVLLLLRLPTDVMLVAFVYLVLTLAYSFGLKKTVVLDVLALAALFTLRVAAGAGAAGAEYSFWLLTFSLFFFFSLAMVKRYAELDAYTGAVALPGRGYLPADKPVVLGIGLAACFAATLVFIIYLVDEQFPRAIFHSPSWLWPICGILLYWHARIWLLAGRGQMQQDPISFALHDKTSLLLGAAVVGCIALAW